MCNHFSCLNLDSVKDKFNINYEQTDKGIQINVEPKDKSKTESFKKFIEACRDFHDCEC